MRLTAPYGTVVRCEGDLAANLLALGWQEADAENASEKQADDAPKRRGGRQRKSE